MFNRFVTLALLVLGLAGCSSTIVNQDPTGQFFPNVQGTSLAGETFEIPGGLQRQTSCS